MPNGAQNGRPSASDPGFGEALRAQTQGYIEKRKADAARLVSDVGDAIRDTGATGCPSVPARSVLALCLLYLDIDSLRTGSALIDGIRFGGRNGPDL